MSALRRLATLLAALALLGGLPACSDAPPPPETGNPSLESFAVRHVLVRFDREPPPGSPKAGAPPPAAGDPLPPATEPGTGGAPEPGSPTGPKRYGRTREEALARAREVTKRARAPGASFEAIARETSDDETTKSVGGFAGFLQNSTGPNGRALEPGLLEALTSLAVGGVSDPVVTRHGVHVLQRISREEGKKLEEQVVASVDGFVVPWHPIAPTLDRSITKDVAYASAVRVVDALRSGVPPDVASTKAENAIPMRDAMRPTKGTGWEPLWEAAIKLKPMTEWTDPIETPGGWGLVRRLPYYRCYVRHLVVTHRLSRIDKPDPRSIEDARKRAEGALAKIRADRASWDEVVRSTSDEVSSRDQGGYMGDVSSAAPQGQRVTPEFEAIIEGLVPGQISDVVETSVGFHVFWRVD